LEILTEKWEYEFIKITLAYITDLYHVTDFTKKTLENLLKVADFKTLYIDEQIESVFKINQTKEKIILSQNKDAVSGILDVVKSQNFFKSLFRN